MRLQRNRSRESTLLEPQKWGIMAAETPLAGEEEEEHS